MLTPSKLRWVLRRDLKRSKLCTEQMGNGKLFDMNRLYNYIVLMNVPVCITYSQLGGEGKK